MKLVFSESSILKKQCLLFDQNLKQLRVVRTVFKYFQSANTNSEFLFHLKFFIIRQILLIIILIKKVLTHDIFNDLFRHFKPKFLFTREMRVRNGPYVSLILQKGSFFVFILLLVLLPYLGAFVQVQSVCRYKK